jgi:hypothetical protein
MAKQPDSLQSLVLGGSSLQAVVRPELQSQLARKLVVYCDRIYQELHKSARTINRASF